MLQRRAFHSILLAREDHWLKYLSLLCPHLSRCDDGVFSRSKPCHSLGWTVAKRLTRDVLIQVLLRPEPIRVAAIEVGKVALRAARGDIALQLVTKFCLHHILDSFSSEVSKCFRLCVAFPRFVYLGHCKYVLFKPVHAVLLELGCLLLALVLLTEVELRL